MKPPSRAAAQFIADTPNLPRPVAFWVFYRWGFDSAPPLELIDEALKCMARAWKSGRRLCDTTIEGEARMWLLQAHSEITARLEAKAKLAARAAIERARLA